MAARLVDAAFALVYLRLLGRADVGAFTFLVVFTTYLDTLIDFGLNAGVAGDQPRDNRGAVVAGSHTHATHSRRRASQAARLAPRVLAAFPESTASGAVLQDRRPAAATPGWRSRRRHVRGRVQSLRRRG